MAKLKIRVGDVVAIPVNRRFVLAKILFLSHRYKGIIMIGFYNLKTDDAIMPEVLPCGFDWIGFTVRLFIDNGRWRIVGNAALLGVELQYANPRYLVAGDLWEGDNYLHPATADERKITPDMSPLHCRHMEMLIADKLGEPYEDEQTLTTSQPLPLTLESGEFLGRICRARTAKPLVGSFNAITKGDYLEADECNQALAAAEVAAACRGFPVAGMPGDITGWCARHRGLVDSQLISQAELAVKRILQDSELKELWSEGDDGAEWVTAVEDLLHRLAAAR